MLEVVVSGLVTGLAIAVPIGAVGAFLVTLTARTSWRVGSAAALGGASAPRHGRVAEEGVELALARMKDDHGEIANEAADLLFHMMVLLADASMSLDDALEVLKKRHGKTIG